MEEGDIVLCTVNKIVGTTVFVSIDGNGEGSISFSEVAPGRIRNIRNYVVPKKKIVCKILRMKGKNIELSFRRVSKKERKERLERAKTEKSYESILKSILKERAKEVIRNIKKEEQSLFDFFQESKQDSKKLENYMDKKFIPKIQEILKTQKKKKIMLKKEILLSTKEPDGIEQIREIFGRLKGIDAKYLSAGKYVLALEAEDPKKGSAILKNAVSDIEKKAKKRGFEFSIKEK